jgi:fatty-acyl-CoA synthase
VRIASSSGLGRHVAWEAVDARGERLAATLRRVGMGTEWPVVIVGDTSLALTVAVRAALGSGRTLAVLAPPGRRRSLEELRRQLRTVAPALVLCDPDLVPAVQAAMPATREIGRVGALQALALDDTVAPVEHRDASILQFTSGTTGEPRAVIVSAANLLANVEGVVDRTGFDSARDRILSWLPLYHDMGLIGMLVLAMLRGIDLVLASPSAFAGQPALWSRWCSWAEATVVCAPQFAYSLAARKGIPRSVDLSRVRLALNGSEPVDPTGVERFIAAAAGAGFDANAMCCVYGLSEATLAVTIPSPGSGMTTDRVGPEMAEYRDPATLPGRSIDVARLGTALDGHALRVLDDTGKDAGTDRLGTIHVQGPSVTAGFWREPGTRAPDAWLNTGDLGYIGAHGELVVCGRRSDIVIVGGRNYSPIAIEIAAAAVQGVRPGGVAAFGTQELDYGTNTLVVVAEVKAPGAASPSEIRAAVMDAVGLVPRDVVLAPAGSLPKTTSGKVRRARSRELYEAGTFATSN